MSTESGKGKRGRPLGQTPTKGALHVRRHRARQKLKPQTPEDLATLANERSDRELGSVTEGLTDQTARGAYVVAERITRRALRDMAPAAGMFTPEIMQEAQAMSREALLLMVRSVPRLTEAIIRLAEAGDATAMTIAARWLPSPQDALSLQVPEGLTPEEASDFLTGQALTGHLSVKEAAAGLKLIETHANVQLNQALIGRLQDLRTKLERLGSVPKGAIDGRPLRPVHALSDDGHLVELADDHQTLVADKEVNHEIG